MIYYGPSRSHFMTLSGPAGPYRPLRSPCGTTQASQGAYGTASDRSLGYLGVSYIFFKSKETYLTRIQRHRAFNRCLRSHFFFISTSFRAIVLPIPEIAGHLPSHRHLERLVLPDMGFGGAYRGLGGPRRSLKCDLEGPQYIIF